MSMYVLLPIDKIEKGSEILIYGAGDIGRCMLQQINIINYCNVIGFIDQKANQIGTVDGIKCYLPDDVKLFPQVNILIAKLNINSVPAIISKLKELGVEDNRIILIDNKYIVETFEKKIVQPDEVIWEDYYLLAEKYANDQYSQIMKPLLDRHNLLRNNMLSVMDFACGYGRIADIIRGFCNTIICCDLEGEAISYCKTRFQEDKKVKYAISRLEGIEVEDGVCDFIYSWDAMVHFSADLIKFYLKEFNRIVKKDGYVLVHHSNLKNAKQDQIYEQWSENPLARSNISKEEFAEIAVGQGFHIVEQKVIDWGGIKELDCITILKVE